MDQMDLDIIAQLQRDGRKSYTDIAKELSVSEGTIRNRVSKLIADKAIQIVGEADPHMMGFNAPAIIGISVQPQLMDEVAERLTEIEEVSYLVLVSGEYDLIVEVTCRDREHLAHVLNEEIRKVPGVVKTQTFFILHAYKLSFGAVPLLPRREYKK